MQFKSFSFLALSFSFSEAMKYHGLGRGLSALISKKNNQVSAPGDSGNVFPDAKLGEAIFYIEIDKINPNPQQPRKEFNENQLNDLANSISEHGILQPLVVSKIEKITSGGIEVSYQLVAGERRLRAAKLAGLFQVPTIIKKTTPRENLELAIIENIQRSDLNAVEKAMAYQKLIEEYNLSQQEMADRVGKSRESIANILRLLSLPPEIKEAISSGKINEGHARAILMVKDLNSQMDLFYKILNMGLNVREVETIARTASSNKKILEIDPNSKYLISQLEDALGVKISLKPKANGGRLIIEYYGQDSLEDIVGKICKI